MVREYEIEIQWTAFPLHPETPEDGQSLEQLFAGRLDLNQVKSRLKQAARDAGLPLGDRKMTYNSRLAQELGKWAETKGKGTEFHHRAFKAYFVDGINIGKISELSSMAGEIGLAEDEAREVLQKKVFKEAVDSDWIRSHQKGIQAVPTFLLGQRVLVGAQPYEKIAAFLESGGIKKRADRD
ncbi:MAG: DsbA family protein [Deltaproteobacteria bacterium]|nr:DsbA family protein [Deltaproteobacteria bacterium]